VRGGKELPIIQVELLEGRTQEQKKAMVKAVTEAVVQTINCPPEAVSIIIRDMKKENYAKAGILAVDFGSK
jgi:4-oxalocrotonate tautomerase